MSTPIRRVVVAAALALAVGSLAAESGIGWDVHPGGTAIAQGPAPVIGWDAQPADIIGWD
ncbi:hypothetical protein ABZZ17_09685 [Streptomyces sp. NPDC006512]|uniref:hypothetical protein n=1 Tax=Streptomyces sp. NPDC006512 TaxID=3154307 RepID=UPI0033BB5CB7